MPDEFPAVTWPSGPVSERQRGQLLRRRVPARVLVDADRHRLAPARRHRHRHDLLGEAAVVGGRHGPDVRVVRPVVGLLAGDAALAGGVLAHRDQHVGVGRLGRVGVARRHEALRRRRRGRATSRRAAGCGSWSRSRRRSTTSAMPERMLAAASWTAIIPVAHWRCTAPPGVSGGSPRALAT